MILPVGDAGEALDGVGALGGLDVGADLLMDGRVDVVVDDVDVEAGGVGASSG